jgi:pimeloyl-ACP methyl ester carboxylesterase
MTVRIGRWWCAAAAVLLALGGALALSWEADRPLEILKARWAAADSGSKFVDVRGMNVHYRDQGPHNELAPIVLLHGTGASLHTWDGWAAELSKTRRVIRMDLPGFGLTGPYAGAWLKEDGGQYSLVNYARFVVGTLDALSVTQPVVLAGNSLGGQIAWETADYLKTAAPERVARLILVDSAGYDFKAIEMPMAFEAAQVALLSPITQNTLPRWLIERDVRSVYGEPNLVTKELVDRYFDLALREGNRRALGLRMREPRAIAPERIAQIKQPTLIIWGGQDRLIPPSNAALFARDIRGSKLVMFDQLGHVPHEEDAQQTVAAVMAFLAAKSGG